MPDNSPYTRTDEEWCAFIRQLLAETTLEVVRLWSYSDAIAVLRTLADELEIELDASLAIEFSA